MVSTDKENRPRRTARIGKQPESKLSDQAVRLSNISNGCTERTVKTQEPAEISQLMSLECVENEVVDFQKFCKGWEKVVNLTKIGQGSFATVIKMELKSAPGQHSVWKLMPLKPSQGSGSRPHHIQTLIKDAATEVKMLVAMSEIDGFVQFRSAHVVKGFVPDQIGKAHESWAKDLHPSDMWYQTNMRVEYPSPNQLWLLMEMTDAGTDLDSRLGTARVENSVFTVDETWDVFWGIAEALMRGEAGAEFEHRDLHAANICIKRREEPLEVTTEHGVPRLSELEVTLIDYTQSRITLDSGDVLATAVDESIFGQTGEDAAAQRQYDTYRDMRSIVKREKKAEVNISQMWKEYVPTTNVLWLHFILDEQIRLTRAVHGNQEDSKRMEALLSLNSKLSFVRSERSEYNSAQEVVFDFIVNLSQGG